MIKNAGGVNMEEDIIKENLDIDERKKNGVKYMQSANTLFNFMPKIEYLYKKLKEKRIVPRYVSEDAQYLKVPNLQSFETPMICFCDINLHKISPHARGYGKFNGYGCFAIAFSKEFCLRQSVQPVHYINENSDFFNSFSNALNTALDYIKQQDTDLEIILDQFVKNIMYMKPLSGTQNAEIKNFHDEQEWRFVPDLSQSDMPSFLINKGILSCKETLYKYNKAIEKIAEAETGNGTKDTHNICFKFEYSDIKYLIIDREKNRTEFIKWIMQLKNDENCSDEDCIDLVSKIRVLDTIEEDA